MCSKPDTYGPLGGRKYVLKVVSERHYLPYTGSGEGKWLGLG